MITVEETDLVLTVGLLPLDGGAFQARVRIDPFTTEASVQTVAREMLQSDNGFGISFEREFYRLDDVLLTWALLSTRCGAFSQRHSPARTPPGALLCGAGLYRMLIGANFGCLLGG